MEERKYLYIVGGNVIWGNHHGKQYAISIKTKYSYHIIQQSHSWIYIQKKQSF